MNASEIAKVIQAQIDNTLKGLKKTYKSGIVSAVHAGNLADIKIDGNDTATPNILCIDNYLPLVNDKVLVLSIGETGANLVCLGSTNGGAASRLTDGSVTPAKRSGGFWTGFVDLSGKGTGSGKTFSITGDFVPKGLVVLNNGRNGTTVITGSSGSCYYNGSSYVQNSYAFFDNASSVAGSMQSSAHTFLSQTGASTVQFKAAVTGFSLNTITLNIANNSGDTYAQFNVMVFG